MNKPEPVILVTPGEPAGIGPDIVIKAVQHPLATNLIAVADPDLLQQRAKLLQLPLRLQTWQPGQSLTPAQSGRLYILPVKELVKSTPGELNPGNSEYVLTTLKVAASLCLEGQAQALVTGPVHKGTMNRASISFTGHTEYLAQLAQVEHTVMLFVVNELKVALATTHLPLAQVSRAITRDSLHKTLTVLHHSLINHFGVANPHVFVCGLNPHAGESGYLGREEIDIISPVIASLRDSGLQLTGPLPADTIFTPPYLKSADAILAMYHDQGLPIVKYLGFNHAVNVTLGLPFIRTSVDHGTAVDIAGTGKANERSLLSAIDLAVQLSQRTLRLTS